MVSIFLLAKFLPSTVLAWQGAGVAKLGASAFPLVSLGGGATDCASASYYVVPKELPIEELPYTPLTQPPLGFFNLLFCIFSICSHQKRASEP